MTDFPTLSKREIAESQSGFEQFLEVFDRVWSYSASLPDQVRKPIHEILDIIKKTFEALQSQDYVAVTEEFEIVENTVVGMASSFEKGGIILHPDGRASLFDLMLIVDNYNGNTFKSAKLDAAVHSLINFLKNNESKPEGNKNYPPYALGLQKYGLLDEHTYFGEAFSKNASLSDLDTDRLKSCLSTLISYVLQCPMDIELSKFIINWMDGVINKVANEDITKNAELCKRMVMGHMTILEAITVQRKLLDTINKMKDYSFPQIEVSKHYLEALEGKE